jgi:DNA-binding response OmpR family regulator
MADAWLYSSGREAAWEVGAALAELGFSPRYLGSGTQLVPDTRDGVELRRPSLAVVVAGMGAPPPPELLTRLRSAEEFEGVGLLLAIDPDHLRTFGETNLADELLVKPFSLEELAARVVRATTEASPASGSEVIRAGSLELNLATYQVLIDGRPIGFAYMEYELLKFLVTHPNRVFSREALLSRVWGYDYYGGARTVDVHIRRVRAKLGQEHAARIKTVRSVGYLFERRKQAGSETA